MSLPPVALVHGLGPRVGVMWPMCRRFRSAGRRAVCLGYNTRHLDRDAAKAALRQQMERFANSAKLDYNSTTWDYIGFSMGGVLGAELMAEGAPPIRRLVQIGSPNAGSPLADRALRWPVKPLGRMGPGLQDGQGLTVDLSDRAADITVITGTGWPDWFDLGPDNDGLVPAASARAIPHRVQVDVPGFHAALPLKRAVQEAALAALSRA